MFKKIINSKLSMFNNKGFTLIELLVALMITSIIMTSLATLAYAIGTANDSSDDVSKKQAQVRYTTLKIADMIKQCKLVCGTPSNDIVIWKADDNANDKIDVTELAYIEVGLGRNYVSVLEFSTCPAWLTTWFRNYPSQFSILETGSFRDLLVQRCTSRQIQLIPECQNAQFMLDDPANIPQTKLVALLFDLQEGGVVHTYQISSSLRGQAGHLLDQTASCLVSDDD